MVGAHILRTNWKEVLATECNLRKNNKQDFIRVCDKLRRRSIHYGLEKVLLTAAVKLSLCRSLICSVSKDFLISMLIITRSSHQLYTIQK